MATAQVKHHDYHLVDPSPWPAVGSISAFIMAVGAITWMHHMTGAAPIIFFIGVIGVLYTMASWWTDVIREAQYKGDHTRVVQISHRYGMILFIASEVMFFVAWFWAFFNRRCSRRTRFTRPVMPFLDAAPAPRWAPAASRHLAAEGHRGVRSLASAAAQHAPAADLGHHGDLGAPCAPGKRPSGPEIRPVADHRARSIASPACRLTNTATRCSVSPATSTARPSSWRPASTASMCWSARSS